MGWKEAQEAHRQLGSLNKQTVEDLVARRVLKGLGLTPARLYAAERELFGRTDGDDPIWARTYRVLEGVWNREVATQGLLRYWRLEVVTAKDRPGHVDIMDRLSILAAVVSPEARPLPVLLVRYGKSTRSAAYVVMAKADTQYALKPPWIVLFDLGPHFQVHLQQIDHFVEQFGPYGSPE